MHAYFYLDGSALVKHYSPERGSAIVDYLIEELHSNRMIVSIWGIAEAVAALNRRKNSEPAAVKEFSALMFKLLSESADFWNLQADHADVRASFPLIVRHNLNATDALHLHLTLKAKQAIEQFQSTVVMVASDHRLIRASEKENIVTIDPEQITTSELKKFR